MSHMLFGVNGRLYQDCVNIITSVVIISCVCAKEEYSSIVKWYTMAIKSEML